MRTPSLVTKEIELANKTLDLAYAARDFDAAALVNDTLDALRIELHNLEVEKDREDEELTRAYFAHPEQPTPAEEDREDEGRKANIDALNER